MSYICYVYDQPDQVPYMEVVAASTLAQARSHALRLLLDRPHCNTAELWDADRLIDRLGRDHLDA